MEETTAVNSDEAEEDWGQRWR